MERDSLVGGTEICLAYFLGLNPAEEFIHHSCPREIPLSPPRVPMHTHIYTRVQGDDKWREKKNENTFKKTNLSSGSSVKLL